MSELRMGAYYYGFYPTGVREIDEILSAIATAGKWAHHTECWSDDEGGEPEAEHLVGKSPVDWIQNAANRAAEKNRAAEQERDQLRERVENPWISVEDSGEPEYPQHGEVVLVREHSATGISHQLWRVDIGDHGLPRSYPGFMTHWMPIPPLPEGEEQQ